MSTGRARQRLLTGEQFASQKKRPAPEGTGLPGVVSFDIVNWEGNYILDTNTFLIVIVHARTLVLIHSDEQKWVRCSGLRPHFEVQMRACGMPRVTYGADNRSRAHLFFNTNTYGGEVSIDGLVIRRRAL